MNQPEKYQGLARTIDLQVGGLRFVEVGSEDSFSAVKRWLAGKGAMEIVKRQRAFEGAEAQYSHGVISVFFQQSAGGYDPTRVQRLFPEIPRDEFTYADQRLAENSNFPGVLFAEFSPDLIQELQGRRNLVNNVLSQRGVPIFVFLVGENVSSKVIPPDLFSVRSGPNIQLDAPLS